MRDASRLGVILLLSLGSLASCRGGEGKFDLTLRSRQPVSADQETQGCAFWLDPHHTETTTKCVESWAEGRWVAADGRRAVMQAGTVTTYYSSRLDEPVTCNGHQPDGNQWWFKWSVATDDRGLTIDDGNELALHDEQGMATYDGIEITCSEWSGKWLGTAGKLSGHEGTFTSVYDSVQIVLHLVEE